MWATVTSHTFDDFATFKNWAPVNTKLAAMLASNRRAVKPRSPRSHNREFDEWRRGLVQGEIRWDTIEVSVDGVLTAFSLMEFGDRWVAVCQIGPIAVLIQVCGATSDGLALERILNPPPLQPPTMP